MPAITIGLLDFGYRKKNTNGITVLNDIFEYVTLADNLGFFCYWLSEHHNSSQAWSSPEMLLPLLAGHTNRINIGLAGVLLAVHSPYRVALNFKLLDNMFPGRIDLGLANGSLHLRFAQKLLSNSDIDESYPSRFQSNVNELLTYLRDEESLFKNEQMMIPPFGGTIPRIWKLSTSFRSIDECIEKKINLCRSLFHTKEKEPFDKTMLMMFKEKYFEAHQCYPRINIAFSGLCEKNSSSARRTFSRLGLNKLPAADNFIVGCPSYFKDRLLEIQEESGINEFVFFDHGLNSKKRMTTLQLIAKEFSLS